MVNSMASGKMYTSEVFMRKRYLMDRKSPEEIAKECGCSVETVDVYLAKFGLRKSKR
jgi:DNA-directed RNA polymerase specialized sigma24 family protein